MLRKHSRQLSWCLDCILPGKGMLSAKFSEVAMQIQARQDGCGSVQRACKAAFINSCRTCQAEWCLISRSGHKSCTSRVRYKPVVMLRKHSRQLSWCPHRTSQTGVCLMPRSVHEQCRLRQLACGSTEKAFKAAFMVSPSHSPGRGMLDVMVRA